MPFARGVKRAFARVAGQATRAAGSAYGFGIAALVVIVWAFTGPFFGFSDTWQLVINTGTTVVTFLMVFLIQHSQNKDTRAVQLKLNELIAAVEGASNRLIDVEDLDEEELEVLHHRYQKLVELVKTHTQGSKETVEEAPEGKFTATDKHLREHFAARRRRQRGA